MDVERCLVSKIITTGQLEEAIAHGVDETMFMDDECRDMFKYLVRHKRKYKSAPSLEAVKEQKPDFEWLHVSDPLKWVIDRFSALVKKRLALELNAELAKNIDDPEREANIEEDFLEAAQKIARIMPSANVSRFSDVDKRIAEQRKRQKEDDPLGIKYGYPTLDGATGGIQPHEFVTVLGFTGVGKSTLLWNLAFNFWAQGKTPLYISLEMEASVLLRKFDAMAAGLSYWKLKHLALSDEELDDWHSKAAVVRDSVADIPIIDSIYRCTPTRVFAEAHRFNPDIIILDYLSLMKSSGPQRGIQMWQSLTEITQDLKLTARQLRIPILAAAQTNRMSSKEGAELDNVGYSSSVVQDSDVSIGLAPTEDEQTSNIINVRILKNRDGPRPHFKSNWDHESFLYSERNFEEDWKRKKRKTEKKELTPIEKLMNKYG